MKPLLHFVLASLFAFVASADHAVVSFEAESFTEQSNHELRSWHLTSATSIPQIEPDADPAHLEGASGGAYLEILPDSRRNHDEKLIKGVNFSPEPGQMAILKYRIAFPKPGKYYVWARVYSTGTEDNGFHIGLNGEWPESGQRWQTVVKNRWHWECKQRTEEVHIGVPMQLFLEIPSAGEHEILISMREDGCELDKLVLATDLDFRPEGYTREPEKQKALSKAVPSS
ncbi:MAG: hypothetical protein AAGH89_12620 [Verrucomicrobiota bacterium]